MSTPVSKPLLLVLAAALGAAIWVATKSDDDAVEPVHAGHASAQASPQSPTQADPARADSTARPRASGSGADGRGDGNRDGNADADAGRAAGRAHNDDRDRSGAATQTAAPAWVQTALSDGVVGWQTRLQAVRLSEAASAASAAAVAAHHVQAARGTVARPAVASGAPGPARGLSKPGGAPLSPAAGASAPKHVDTALALAMPWLKSAWGSMTPPPPPPPKPVPPPPPPPPTAPAFPDRWIGRFNDEAPEHAAAAASGVAAQPVRRAILEGSRSTLVVQVGDVIEGTWRVDQIQDKSMTVTYLPLQQSVQVYMR